MATVRPKVEHINPFVEAVNEIYRSMLDDVQVSRGTPRLLDKNAKPREIMGLIGISGAARGAVVICLPQRTAQAIVRKILDEDVGHIASLVVDGVAEFVNMIAGYAKAQLKSDDGPPLELGLPTVIQGADFTLDSKSGSIWIEIEFQSALGPFELRLLFESHD